MMNEKNGTHERILPVSISFWKSTHVPGDAGLHLLRKPEFTFEYLIKNFLNKKPYCYTSLSLSYFSTTTVLFMCKEKKKIKLLHRNHNLVYSTYFTPTSKRYQIETHPKKWCKIFGAPSDRAKHQARRRPTAAGRARGYPYAATLVMPQERSARRTHSGKRKQSTRWSMAMPAACMKE